MQLDDLFHECRNFSFIINTNYVIEAVSVDLDKVTDTDKFIAKSIFDVFKELFKNETFSNRNFLGRFYEKIINSMTTKQGRIEKITVTNDLSPTGFFYRFRLGIDVYHIQESKAVVKIVEFKKMEHRDELYHSVFEQYAEEFKGLNNLFQVGKFVIDYPVSKNLLYATDFMPELIGIEKSPSNTYYISRNPSANEKNVIPAQKSFFIKADKLLTGEVNYLTDIWNLNDKYLEIEAKILKRDKDGNPILLGGIAKDITKYKEYNDLHHLNSIYDLAIKSGGIGIFYYDVDVHGFKQFEANQIYADLIGLTPNDVGLYLMSDFKDSILSIESELTEGIDIKETLANLMQGNVEGTEDDIIKIRNLKSGEELYILSSSRIVERYEDGKPKKFGGFVKEITERIQREKNKIEFAYTDELTQLPNKRKLMRDIKEEEESIGLFIDLDNFKKVNDTYGHSVGDEILKQFGHSILKVSKRYKDVYPYRLYGDEFFVLIKGQKDDVITRFPDEVKEYVNRNISIQNIEIDFSVGYSHHPVGRNVDEFIKEADYKMYEEKISKKRKL